MICRKDRWAVSMYLVPTYPSYLSTKPMFTRQNTKQKHKHQLKNNKNSNGCIGDCQFTLALNRISQVLFKIPKEVVSFNQQLATSSIEPGQAINLVSNQHSQASTKQMACYNCDQAQGQHLIKLGKHSSRTMSLVIENLQKSSLALREGEIQKTINFVVG